MPVPDRAWVEAQSGVDGLKGIYHRDFAWPIPDEDDEAYWGIKTKEPYVRHECHLNGRVIVYALPTKEAWPKFPPGTPMIYRLISDGEYVRKVVALTAEEVAEYRESMYGVKNKPPVRPAKAPGTAAKKTRRRKAKKQVEA